MDLDDRINISYREFIKFSCEQFALGYELRLKKSEAISSKEDKP